MNTTPSLELTIEAGIPLPERRTLMGRPGKPSPYTPVFEKMEIGHSFHLRRSEDVEEAKRQAKALAQVIQGQNKRGVRRFAMRAVGMDDRKGPGFRVWRVELKPKDN